jgi:hypothetical protein
LPTVQITSVALNSDLANTGGVSASVGATLSNPSIATLNLGDTTFTIKYQGIVIGTALVSFALLFHYYFIIIQVIIIIIFFLFAIKSKIK